MVWLRCLGEGTAYEQKAANTSKHLEGRRNECPLHFRLIHFRVKLIMRSVLSFILVFFLAFPLVAQEQKLIELHRWCTNVRRYNGEAKGIVCRR